MKAFYPLRKMFDSIPGSYDSMNRILTCGMDSSWRRRAARLCLEKSPSSVLDLCCGTGDLAVTMAGIAGDSAAVTGLDFSPGMITAAVRKAEKMKVRVPFVLGDASALPFPDGSFDSVGIAFAFRNLSYKNPKRDPALAEILRVIRPGGRFVIVESSKPKNRIIRLFFNLYLKIAVELLGGFISGDRGPYRYLAHSARHFHPPGELTSLMAGAGFVNITHRGLFFGAAAIHCGEKAG